MDVDSSVADSVKSLLLQLPICRKVLIEKHRLLPVVFAAQYCRSTNDPLSIMSLRSARVQQEEGQDWSTPEFCLIGGCKSQPARWWGDGVRSYSKAYLRMDGRMDGLMDKIICSFSLRSGLCMHRTGYEAPQLVCVWFACRFE